MPVPFFVMCDGCGFELEVKKRYMDSGGDVCCDIKRCEHCTEESYLKGIADARKPGNFDPDGFDPVTDFNPNKK